MEVLGRGPVALDTAIFIYYIEEHPRYLPLIDSLFGSIDDGRIEAVTSSLTLLETLVIPNRTGNRQLAESYENLLRHSRGLSMIELGYSLLRTAADLRARAGLKTPDALQIAAAIHSKCRFFLTHDRRLPQIPDLRILRLSSFL